MYRIHHSLYAVVVVVVVFYLQGANELGLPAYQALVEPSGGYVLPHLSFTTPHLEHNLKFLLQHTFMSKSRSTPDDLEEDGGGPPECFVDIRADRYVLFVIGIFYRTVL
jgi:hypothetical protein